MAAAATTTIVSQNSRLKIALIYLVYILSYQFFFWVGEVGQLAQRESGIINYVIKHIDTTF